MRIKLVIAGIVTCAGLVAVSGCKKEEAVSVPPETKKTSESVIPQTENAVVGAASQVNQTADTMAAGVTQAVQAAAPDKAAQDQAQSVIDKAQGLVKDQKYQEALSSLGQLASFKLTPDQQKLVDALKAQIQTALAKAAGSGASSALGGALGGKK